MNSLRHGSGVFKSSCEQYYEGEWHEGKRHGQGKMIYNKHGTVSYSGEWCNGNRQGYGIMRYASGNNYEGYWYNDKKSGRGYMIWRDLDELYCGDWLNDLPHGNGEHIWGDSSSKLATRQLCNIYRGSFESGVRSGLGTFFYSNGSQYSGIYSLTHSLTHSLTYLLTHSFRYVAKQYETW